MVAHAPELHAPALHADGHGGGPQKSVWLRGSWVRAFWVSAVMGLAAAGLVMLIRHATGRIAYSDGVVQTFLLIFAGVGFTIGIGCWDYWWGYLIGNPTPAHEDHSSHGAYTWKDYFKVNTDHKVIGIQYLVTTFIFFIIGGLMAEGVRAELATPGLQYFSPATYNALFSVHAALMIFLFVIPAFAGLGNFVIPIMLGAQDMAFPRLNALSFWMLPVAGMCMVCSFLVGPFNAGWTNYAPLSTFGPPGETFWIMGVQFAGASSIATAVNFLVTIVTMRAPGMGFWRMPLLVWANLATSTLVVLGTPFIAGSQFMVLFDRIMHAHFFDATNGGNVVVYQHIFWFYSHPAVYIMMLPGFGIISEVLAIHSRKPIFGYKLIAISTVAIGVLGFTVWAHHMFTSGMAPWLRVPMMFTTMAIAVPTGIKIFSWVATLWRGVIHLTTPMLFACGFLFTFVIGGLSGIFLAVVPGRHQPHRHLLRGRPHPLRAVRRLGVHDLRRHLPLVPQDDRPDVRRGPRQAALLAHVRVLQRDLHAHALAGDGGDDPARRRLPVQVGGPQLHHLDLRVHPRRVDAGVHLQHGLQLVAGRAGAGQPVAGADARVAGHLTAADLQLRRAAADRGQPVRLRRPRCAACHRHRARPAGTGGDPRPGRTAAGHSRPERGDHERAQAHPRGGQPDRRR